ncbi:DUF2341 domain-containing protein [Patescibacteria group bacterium]|nr:DUF2341 domain-containing protein [Patescibacteria group bacterium]
MKLSKKTIIIGISTLAVAGASLAFYFISKDNADVLGWMSSSWLYRKAISVANGGSELINEEVLITMDTATLISAGKMQNDCDDLRFTDSDESTALAYWVEGGCNTSSTQIWARIPSLTAGGKTIYVYYGNTTAANSEESWSGEFMLLNTTSCPSGWTRETGYDDKYAYGASSFGASGGATTHNNGTPSCTTGGPSSTAMTQSDSGGATASPTHTHTSAMVSVDDITNAPPFLDMVYCVNPDLNIDSGMVAMFTSTPSGWTRFSALDSKFAKGASSYGGTGGATTHTHTTTGGYTTGSSGTRNDSPGGGNGAGNHTHTTANGVTGSGNSIPPYLDMVYATKDSAGSATSGLISMTTDTPPMGWSRYTALDGLFPRGAATQGGTGGVATHTHSVTIVTNAGGGYDSTGDRALSAAGSMHTHSCSTTTASASNVPAYIETLFYQRKDTEIASLGTEEVGNIAPNAPTLLLTEGLTDPLKISDVTPELSAVFTDPDSADTGKYYQIQVNTSSDFTGTVMWDTTQTILSPELSNGSRMPDVSYAGTDLSTSVIYYWRIKFWDNAVTGSQASPWSATAQFAIGVDSWGNLNYLYRKPMNVSNSQGTTLTDEDILVQLDTATLISEEKLQIDCDDLRFYDSDDATPLDYWIEGGCNTSSTQIWVRIPSLPSGGKTIFVYYDNPTDTSASLTWGGDITLLADASCPSGWTLNSALQNRLPYGSSTYGTTGGSNTHDHGTIIGSASSVSGETVSAGAGSDYAVKPTHTHEGFSAVIESASLLPPYLTMLYCSSTDFTIPTALISIFDDTAPTGWTRFSALDDKYPEGSSSYGATGGSNTHTHTATNGSSTDVVGVGDKLGVQLQLPSASTDGALTVSASTTVNINTTNTISGRSCSQGGDAVNYSVIGLSSSSATISTTLAAGCLAAGDEVLLINLQGTSSYNTNVGNYETLKVSSASGTTVTFTTNKTKYYGNGASDDTNLGTATTNQRVMLQRVPQYSNVTIGTSGVLTANGWDGTKGGVLYFNASGTVTNSGSINMDYKGYRGGPRTTGASAGKGGEAFCANPGGGGQGAINGVCGGGAGGGIANGTAGLGSATGGAGGAGGLGGGDPYALGGGGAGGGYGTAGGAGNGSYGGTGGGDNVSGNGGAWSGSQGRGAGGGGGGYFGSSSLDQLYLGSAGASGGATWGSNYGGIGGNSGGIIYITAGTLTNGGTGILARGQAGGNGTGSGNYITGAGGGGSGGSIRIDSTTATIGTSLINATGGAGGTNGYAGGAGGSGRIAISYTSSISGTSTPTYADISSSVLSVASEIHTHTLSSATVGSADNTPPYLNVIFAKNDASKYVTSANILISSELPPLGWNRLTDFDSKFIKGNTTYGASGGTATHTHSVSMSSGAASPAIAVLGTGVDFAGPSHTHSETTDTPVYSNLPAYLTVLYIQRKTSENINIGDETLQNLEPDAPTSLKIQNLTNPLKVTTFTPYFTAIYTDINTADTANYYQINVNTASDFSGTIMWDSGKTAFDTPIENTMRSSNIDYNGDTLVEGEKYYWRIKFWDQNSYQNESPWSTTAEFTIQGIPDAPTSLQTNGAVDPLSLTTVPPAFRAIYSDPNHDNASAYQIQVNSNAFFTGTVLWDSAKTSTSITNGNRSPEYWYDGTDMSNSHNTYYWHIRFWDSDNSVSEWSATAEFTDTYSFSPSTYYEGLKLNGLKLD